MGKIRSSYISGRVTIKKLAVLAAAGRATPDSTRTTHEIAAEAKVARDRAHRALVQFEKDGLVERKRGPHNVSIWTCTKRGFSAMIEAMGQKFYIPEPKQEEALLNPAPLLKSAQFIRKSLKKSKFGWREWQIRRRLRTCSIAKLKRILRISGSKERPGAYAWGATRPGREKRERKEQLAAASAW